ncbi:hypothetical protein B2J93_8801 [Marssonina coronariae]|uniref:Uncharacterized protein n=1 Tax=Diplocarpon coronariae TaxID=2795749 RepID=A0A218YX99_9HELO|nr:hypothetical protein B2J93_8801 [Marssonina coronariae]
MAVNRKVYQETARLLYFTRSSGYRVDVEAILPFFLDIRKHTRPMVHELSLVRHGLIYSRDYDRSLGWEGLQEYSAANFKTLSNVRHKPLELVWEFISINGLNGLEVDAEIHHSPPSYSSSMAFFTIFSLSVEKGFSEFLHSEMIAAA